MIFLVLFRGIGVDRKVGWGALGVEQTVDKNGRTKWQLTPKNRRITVYLVLFRGIGVDRKGGHWGWSGQ